MITIGTIAVRTAQAIMDDPVPADVTYNAPGTGKGDLIINGYRFLVIYIPTPEQACPSHYAGWRGRLLWWRRRGHGWKR